MSRGYNNKHVFAPVCVSKCNESSGLLETQSLQQPGIALQPLLLYLSMGTGVVGGTCMHMRGKKQKGRFLPYFVPVKKGKPFCVQQAAAWDLFLVVWSHLDTEMGSDDPKEAGTPVSGSWLYFPG